MSNKKLLLSIQPFYLLTDYNLKDVLLSFKTKGEKLLGTLKMDYFVHSSLPPPYWICLFTIANIKF